ncbi:MAG: hypothetical protein GOP50_08870 [Candidatus Heimdallarchaeota archaeon]|nr:hypothetical protein [Candidatus Heimdallarchaeota archaeon]
MKGEIREVLQLINKTKKTITKLQKQNKTQFLEETKKDNSSYSVNNSKRIHLESIEFHSNISWDVLLNLTEKKYGSLADNDRLFADLIKSLFFPNLDLIKDVLNNKTNLTEWKRNIKDLKSIFKNQKGISFGEYIFRENLRFSQKIYDSYRKLDLFGKDLDRDYKRDITRDFFDKYGSDITDKIEKKYGLFYEEARVFTIYLACMADFDKTVLGFDYGSMHEFFQNVWMKINCNQDKLRQRQYVSDNEIKQIVHSNFSRFKTSVSSGFDSYFVLLNQEEFELWFVEQKCGNSYVICKNYKNIADPLHKSVFNLANRRTDRKLQDSLQQAGFTVLQSIDFAGALFRRYTYYYDAIGNNFLGKMKVQKYTHDLIFGIERNGFPNAKQLARKLIKAAKDNHRLIALIQNGLTLGEDRKVVKHIDLIDKKKQTIRIFGEIFTFKPTRNKKGEYIVAIEGYSRNLLKKMKKNDPKFNPAPYDQLNNIFQTISQGRNCRIKEKLSSDEYIKVILTNYNDILYEIFNYLTNKENFVSFEKLKDGRTFVCSEIASEEISPVREWLEYNQQRYSAIPYITNYLWKLPFFGKLREISRNDNLKMSKAKELAYKKLFSNNDNEVLSFLEEIQSDDFAEEDYEKRVKANPEYSFLFGLLYLLKGNTWLKLRKNLFEQGDTLRALVFLDEEGRPVRIFGDDEKLDSVENPYLNIKMDFYEIFSKNRLLDRNILSTFPIAIKSGKSAKRYPELKFRFCRADGRRAGEKGKEARRMYIERIREKIGHIEEINDVIDILISKPAIAFNLLRGENREVMMKLFIFLLFEYNEVWKEFSKSVIEYLEKKLQIPIDNMVLSNKFVKRGLSIKVNSVEVSSNGKWLFQYEVLKGSTKVLERKIEVLPAFTNIRNKNTSKENLNLNELTLFCDHNPLYLNVLSILEAEVMPLILVKSEKNIISKIRKKWKNGVNWMEKACV